MDFQLSLFYFYIRSSHYHVSRKMSRAAMAFLETRCIIIKKGVRAVVYKKAKLFWSNNDKNSIIAMPLDDNVDYYSFLRSCRNMGYRQIVVTSEVMMQIIRNVYSQNMQITKIEFMEEDPELDQEISNLLRVINSKPVRLIDLIEKLEFLSEKSSIELRRIYVKKPYSLEECVKNFYIQSNGIIGANNEFFNEITKRLSTIVERCLV